MLRYRLGVIVSLTCLTVDVFDNSEEPLSSMWRMPVSWYWSDIFPLDYTGIMCFGRKQVMWHVHPIVLRIHVITWMRQYLADFTGRFFLFPCPCYPLWKEVNGQLLVRWEWCAPFFGTEYLQKWFIIFLQGTFIFSFHLFNILLIPVWIICVYTLQYNTIL